MDTSFNSIVMKNKIAVRPILLICTLLIKFSALISAQTTLEPKTKDDVERIYGALGFYYGQQNTLDQIETYHPELKTQIALCRVKFDEEFAGAKRTMEQFLIESIGPERLKAFSEKVKETTSTYINYQDARIEDVIAFIEKVQRRSEGYDFESPYFETFLHYKYWKSPQNEILDGYVETFYSKGHAKSAGLDFQLKTPKSFSVEEGDRPNIIKRFKSEEGLGDAIITILAKSIPLSEGKYDMRQDSRALNEQMAKDIMPEGSKFRSFKKSNIDGIPFGMVEFTSTNETIMGTIHTVNLSTFTFIENRMVMISYSCASNGTDDSLFMLYLPTFKLVSNSFILNTQYTKK